VRTFQSRNESKAGNKPANRYWIHIKIYKVEDNFHLSFIKKGCDIHSFVLGGG
jgi:hypothetical protein